MATRVAVGCIRRRTHNNPHERIQGIGGTNPDGTQWYLLEDQAIAGIHNGTYDFWVQRAGFTVQVIVALHLGRYYLKTRNDGLSPDNLLSLPECP